ncbi:DUF7344 domain-containing protein [Haloplanus aerogenes]|uniref:DUF7344 domain-containing protein n=1 Tax=Haloplanus aerogenes TaxID=660522 RepID=A0A3M0DRW8_9EURY|nr:hypothetical protein [Haloplanus aerogenes]AZH25273.1 hypothetical protein DU502_07720 [Haloplanus aerogenes]RMB24965.1 hypothetical protein ATH50_0045 [Haloplanus aerogenes]
MTRSERASAEVDSPLSDIVYQVLGNERRRFVLELLTQQEEPIDIGTLAERVASLENDQSVGEISYDQRKSVYTGLYQNHLPLMERAGLIRSENGWDRIEITDQGSEIQQRLNGADEQSRTSNVLYVALSAFGIGLFLGSWFSVRTLVPAVGFVQGVGFGLSLLAVGYVLTK